MIKREQMVKQIKCTLESNDLKIIEFCLNYTAHRIRAHQKFPEKRKEVDRIRREMGIIYY